MKHYIMRYPGDPPVGITLMTREEFVERYRPSEFKITNLDTGETETRPIGDDEINCDLCNEDPGDAVFVKDNGSRAYCGKCAASSWLPHCKEQK